MIFKLELSPQNYDVLNLLYSDLTILSSKLGIGNIIIEAVVRHKTPSDSDLSQVAFNPVIYLKLQGAVLFYLVCQPLRK